MFDADDFVEIERPQAIAGDVVGKLFCRGRHKKPEHAWMFVTLSPIITSLLGVEQDSKFALQYSASSRVFRVEFNPKGKYKVKSRRLKTIESGIISIETPAPLTVQHVDTPRQELQYRVQQPNVLLIRVPDPWFEADLKAVSIGHLPTAKPIAMVESITETPAGLTLVTKSINDEVLSAPVTPAPATSARPTPKPAPVAVSGVGDKVIISKAHAHNVELVVERPEGGMATVTITGREHEILMKVLRAFTSPKIGIESQIFERWFNVSAITIKPEAASKERSRAWISSINYTLGGTIGIKFRIDTNYAKREALLATGDVEKLAIQLGVTRQ